MASYEVDLLVSVRTVVNVGPDVDQATAEHIGQNRIQHLLGDLYNVGAVSGHSVLSTHTKELI